MALQMFKPRTVVKLRWAYKYTFRFQESTSVWFYYNMLSY